MSTFTVEQDKRGALIVCEHNGVRGAARVFAAGVEDACRRAQAQAMKLDEEAQARAAAIAKGGVQLKLEEVDFAKVTVDAGN